MESSKKKVVTKVIIKNILAWVCTLCMVFCVIPSNARADGEVDDETSIEAAADNSDTEGTTEDPNAGETTEDPDTENTTEDTDAEETTEEPGDVEATTGTVTVTLKLDGESWAEQEVTIQNGNEVITCEYKDGVYTTTVPLDEEVQLQVKDEAVESITLTDSTPSYEKTIDYYTVSFQDNDGGDLGISSQIIRSGECATEPDAPEGDDYLEFNKWVTGQGDFAFTTPITSTTVLYAAWKVSGSEHECTWAEDEDGNGLWNHNETAHWHKCGEEDCPFEASDKDITDIVKAADGYGIHDYSSKVTREPTETTSGWEQLTCTVCGYSYGRAISPVEVEEVEKSVILDSDAENYLVATDLNELAAAILTEEDEIEAFKNGESLTIELTIENISRTIETSTKDYINQYIDTNLSSYSYQVGQYLDINMYKTIRINDVDGDRKTRVTDTNSEITICIDVPDALKDTTGSKGRTYAIIRLHDNVLKLLNDLDDDEGTITFKTDGFSTYVIIYHDTAVTGDSDNNGNDTDTDSTGNSTDNTGSTSSTSSTSGTSSTDSSSTSDGSTIVNNNITITNSSNTETSRNVPKTGDTSPIGIYMTIAILSGFAYLLLLFTDKQRRMSEAEKNDLIASLSAWARKRGVTAKCFAGFSIACILFYYHTVGKRVKAAVKECM